MDKSPELNNSTNPARRILLKHDLKVDKTLLPLVVNKREIDVTAGMLMMVTCDDADTEQEAASCVHNDLLRNTYYAMQLLSMFKKLWRTFGRRSNCSLILVLGLQMPA